jgi:DNA-binding PadR family transcriptional regulator
LNEAQLRIHILAYLNHKEWVNENVIKHKSNIPSQDHKRLRGTLEDMCKMGFLEKREKETGGTRVITEYNITGKGRRMVTNPEFFELLGVDPNILAFLDHKGWVNENVIKHKSNIPSQAHDRLRRTLEDMCKNGFLEKRETETGGTRVITLYHITEKGRKMRKMVQDSKPKED